MLPWGLSTPPARARRSAPPPRNACENNVPIPRRPPGSPPLAPGGGGRAGGAQAGLRNFWGEPSLPPLSLRRAVVAPSSRGRAGPGLYNSLELETLCGISCYKEATGRGGRGAALDLAGEGSGGKTGAGSDPALISSRESLAAGRFRRHRWRALQRGCFFPQWGGVSSPAPAGCGQRNAD